MLEESLSKQIHEAIDEGQPIKVRVYALLAKTEEELNLIVTRILRRFGRENLVGAVYTCVKELALNGAKANIKRILFLENQIDINSDVDYEKGMTLFRSRLNEKWILEYANKAKDQNYYVDVAFNFNDERLIIEVENNSALSEKEDKRIREKFNKGSQYDNIAEFYMDTQDTTEGAGMGITLILMLLKAEGIDPHLFTLRSDYKHRTVARIEFPFTKDYITGREKFDESSR